MCLYELLVDGSECVAAGEKVTNAGGSACRGKFFLFFCFFFFFPSSCCRAENREEIQTKITPVPLPEKCPPLPRRSLQISSLL